MKEANGSKSPGTLGLAPADARVGDYVFLIHGIKKAVGDRLDLFVDIATAYQLVN